MKSVPPCQLGGTVNDADVDLDLSFGDSDADEE